MKNVFVKKLKQKEPKKRELLKKQGELKKVVRQKKLQSLRTLRQRKQLLRKLRMMRMFFISSLTQNQEHTLVSL